MAREDDIDDEPRTAWTSKVPSKDGQVSSSQLDLVTENSIEDEKVKQLIGTKNALVRMLMVIGEYLKSLSDSI